MLLLELAGVVLIFRVALPVAVGAIGVAAGAVDVAEAALAKAGIVAAIGKTAAAKSAAPMESPKTAAERNRVFGPDRDAHGERRPRQQCSRQPLSVDELPGH